MGFSLVIPCHNEASILKRSVDKCREELCGIEHEILLVEDGCTDSTEQVAEELASRNDRVRHLHSEERLGKGGAIELGVAKAEFDALGFTDADLSADIESLLSMTEFLDSYDVVAAQRRVSGTGRKASRRVASLIFNNWVRIWLGSELRDHQCGLKCFSRNAHQTVSPVENRGFLWDTEFLVKAQSRGLDLKALAVDWSATQDSSVDLVSDGLKMFWRTIELKLRLW